MAESSKAVFLSYASQDSDAARMLCEALRAAGVEVWFDQSELRGGDSWDAKIRRQIKECALFLPIISANTQARTEGYFRLEWRLADQRTHLMAKGRAFLLPVVIDDTRDADAHVPDAFLEVQWSRVTTDAAAVALAEQVRALLERSAGSLPANEPSIAGERRQTVGATVRVTAPKKSAWVSVAVAVAIVLVAAFALWPRGPRAAKPAAVASAPTNLGTGSAELAAVRARIVPDRWQKEDFETVSSMLDRIIGANPDSSEAWALRSIINTLQVTRNYESGTAPLLAGQQAADRALRLAPGSPFGELAMGFHLMAMVTRGGDPQAGRPYLDRALAALPPDAITRYIELVSAWQCYDLPRTEQSARAWMAAEPEATLPPWIMAQMAVVQRRPDEVEKWAERAATDRNVTGIRAFYTIFESKYYLRADLAGARAALERVPPSGRLVHRVVHGHWLLAMAERRWEDALQGLSRITDPFLFDRTYHGPRALLAGLANQGAGQTDAAAIKFREAERLLRERLAADAENDELHAELAVTLACLGRAAEARSELALVEPLLTGRVPSIYRGPQTVPVAQARAILGDTERMNFWLRKLFAEPAGVPFTPASLRQDPRFAGRLEARETQALLREFAYLDRPGAGTVSNDKPAPDEKSLVVLPLENLSPDPDNAFFTEGMHAEIIDTLSRIPDLKVVSRSSALTFKDTKLPLPEVARQLGVANVITGSVRRAGNTLRIQLELRRARDEALLWSSPKGDRDLKDALGLQSEVAEQVARVLQAREDKGSSAGARYLATNPRAYDLYLKAHAIYDANTSSRERIGECVAMMDEALRLDPQFMPAARLAGRMNVRLFIIAEDPAERVRYAAEAKRLGEQASRLMPGGAGDTALAFYYASVEGDHVRSLRYAENAIHALPNDAEGYYFAGVAKRNLGQVDEAVRRFEQTEALDIGGVPTWGQHLDALADLRRKAACEEVIARYLRVKDQVVRYGAISVVGARCKLDGTLPTAAELTALASPLERVVWLWRSRQFAELLTLCEARLAAGAAGSTRFLLLWRKADALERLQRKDEALAAAREALAAAEALKAAPKIGVPVDDGRFAIALARLGRSDEALAKAHSYIEAVPAASMSWRWSREIELARIIARAGRSRECVDVLAKLLRVPSGLTVPLLKLEPDWDPVREDAGFKALLADPKNSAPL